MRLQEASNLHHEDGSIAVKDGFVLKGVMAFTKGAMSAFL